MEMEIRECTQHNQRERLQNRVKSHKVEFTRLQSEFDKVKKSKLLILKYFQVSWWQI